MKLEFNTPITDEEILYARRRFFAEAEFIELEPMAVFSFPTYWALTDGGINTIQNTEPYHNLVLRYLNTVALVCDSPSLDPAIKRNILTDHRNWIASLTDAKKESLRQFDNYKYWHPGLLSNDPMTVEGHLALFPNIAGSSDTPPIIWKYENPDSPDCLPGAVDIDTHDTIHVLLGRGALQIDEAFVIGFTMGGASNTLTDEQAAIFANAMANEYPPPYNVSAERIASYFIGVEAGRAYYQDTAIDLSKNDFTNYRDTPVGTLRQKFQIDIDWLADIYNKVEATMTPSTGRAAMRNRISQPRHVLTLNPRSTLG